MKKILILLLVNLAIIIFLATFIGKKIFEPSRVDVLSVVSLDRDFTASVTEVNGGATTSFGYVIKVKNKNQNSSATEVANLYGAVRSDCAFGVDLEWQPNNVLLIKYLEAKNVTFPANKIQIDDQTVIIKLIAGISNKSAPCGGMEENLTR